MPRARRLASPRSLLGMIQRGRGEGLRRAEAAKAAQVRRCLTACLTRDPRWDQQLDDRVSAYTDLALRHGFDEKTLEGHLRSERHEHSEERWCTVRLALDTLLNLAEERDGRARAILERYLNYGVHWARIITALAGMSETKEHIRSLADRVRSRVDDWSRASIDWAAPEGWHALMEALPKRHSLARLARQQLKGERGAGERRDKRYSEARRFVAQHELAAVCRAITDENWHALQLALGRRVKPEDRPFLLDRAKRGRPCVAATALWCLAQIPDAACAPTVFAIFDARIDDFGDRMQRSCLFKAVYALPPEVTLPLARKWFSVKESHRRVVAERILADHAERCDIAMLRASVRTALAADEMYRVSSVMEAFQRFGDLGALPEIDAAFRTATYSWSRLEAAKAMLANAPEVFRRKYADDCLWDSCPEIRELGCEFAPLRTAGSRQRLVMLANDGSDERYLLLAKARLRKVQRSPR